MVLVQETGLMADRVDVRLGYLYGDFWPPEWSVRFVLDEERRRWSTPWLPRSSTGAVNGSGRCAAATATARTTALRHERGVSARCLRRLLRTTSRRPEASRARPRGTFANRPARAFATLACVNRDGESDSLPSACVTSRRMRCGDALPADLLRRQDKLRELLNRESRSSGALQASMAGARLRVPRSESAPPVAWPALR